MTTHPGKTPSFLCSRAWLLVGIGSVPGELSLRSGRLSFIAHGRGTAADRQLLRLGRHACSSDFSARLKAGHRVPLFDQPLADMRVVFPWHFFSGGMVVATRDGTYTFAFGPEPAWDAWDDLKAVARIRRVGKQWIAMLA